MPRLTPEQRAGVIADYVAGHLTVAHIAEKHGTSVSTVSATVKRAGVQRALGQRSSDSPTVLLGGAWVYDSDGVARWTPGAAP